MNLYQVDIGYACFSIEVENDVVKYAPPIAKWTIGKKWKEIEEYYKTKKNAKITRVLL